MGKQIIAIGLVMSLFSAVCFGADWPGFRGPTGMGISEDKNIPLTWSDTKNIQWKIKLPGTGSSSPIVYGDKVFVTCYSGYGTEETRSAELKDLKRHLVCINRSTGKEIWCKAVTAKLPEDTYRGNIAEHGYASNTPVTDGEQVFAFFGKTGVLAFDMKGKQLWQVSVGTESSRMRWGSAASPVLYKDLVIVNASEESVTLYALDKKTGKEVWKLQSSKLASTYGTPLLVDLKEGRKELLIAVPFEVWAFDPASGKCNWYTGVDFGGNISPSVISQDGIVFATGGFPRTGSGAIRISGKDDVTDTHTVWSSQTGSYVPSPVIHDGHLYWVNDRGEAACLEAKTGKVVYQEKLEVAGRGKLVYASVLLVDDKLYAVSRWGGTYVIAAKPKYELLAQNKIESDESDFNASPAISNGQMFLRSNQFLYCIQQN
jgi:outer membrane protein assembly factor BamB